MFLADLNDNSLQQTKSAENTLQQMQMLFDGLKTNPLVDIRYFVFYMIFYINFNVTYPEDDLAKSRVARNYYCSDNTRIMQSISPNDVLILIEYRFLQHVITLAAKTG